MRANAHTDTERQHAHHQQTHPLDPLTFMSLHFPNQTRGEFLREIRLHLDVAQASKCYTYKDNSTLNDEHTTPNVPCSSLRCAPDWRGLTREGDRCESTSCRRGSNRRRCRPARDRGGSPLCKPCGAADLEADPSRAHSRPARDTAQAIGCECRSNRPIP